MRNRAAPTCREEVEVHRIIHTLAARIAHIMYRKVDSVAWGAPKPSYESVLHMRSANTRSSGPITSP